MECPEHVLNLWNDFAIEKCEVEPNEDCCIVIEHISVVQSRQSCNRLFDQMACTHHPIPW